MSAFVGVVRWGDDRRLDPRDGERLTTAIAVPGQARPTLLSLPPFHAAFRQMVVTPEDAWERQPAVEGEAVSLFAGRIDDRKTLAARLDHACDGVPDGALALAAFRRWGAQAPEAIVGEFAWGAWDGAARRLVLARDASLAQSLYVYRSDRCVAFATALPALLALPEVPRDVDEQGIAEFLALHPGIGARTPYRDVRRVTVATTLTIERERLRSATNWTPRAVDVPRDPRECAEAARDVFGQAMRSRLRALGPASVMLSGGLDSSIVAAEAARQRDPDIVHGIVLAPAADAPVALRPWEARDDRAQVAALARAYPNLRTTFVAPGADPLDADPTALFLRTGLPLTAAPSMTWFLAGWRVARDAGTRLIMSGSGGETNLTHYGSLRVVVEQGDLRHALREAWLAAGGRPKRFVGELDRAFLGGRLTRLRHRERRRVPGDWHRYSVLHPDLADAAGVRERLLAEDYPAGWRHQAPGQRELVARSLRWSSLSSDNLAAVRQLTGLASTTPFADRRVVEFCLSLPEAMFVRDGWSRWLARAAFRDLLPPEVRERTIKAAQNGEWLQRMSGHRDAYRAQLGQIGTSPLAQRALDLPRLEALLDRWPDSVADLERLEPEYRALLLRGLHAGAFLRWLDPGNFAPVMRDSRDPA